MNDVATEWVSLESPTMPRAGHGSRPCQGLYHRPAGVNPSIAFIATHYNIDFAEHYLAEHLAARGFGFLGWNTRYRGNEAYFLLEHALVDIGVGVRWLREHAGAETVVVLGNSGGGSLMAAYQSQATDAHITATPGMGLPDAVGDLPAADLYVSLNAHPGRPEVLTSWFDPSVVDESDPVSADPSLDMFAATRTPPYDAEFIDRYRRAQEDRNHRITHWANDELARLADLGIYDRLFTISRTWADLRFADLTIDPSDREPGCYLGDPKRANYSPFGIGSTCTLRTWLSMWSLESSPCRGAPHLQRIAVPSLVIQSTGDRGVFPSDAQAIHRELAAADKELQMVTGQHYFEDGGRDDIADLIAGWTEAHRG